MERYPLALGLGGNEAWAGAGRPAQCVDGGDKMSEEKFGGVHSSFERFPGRKEEEGGEALPAVSDPGDRLNQASVQQYRSACKQLNV